MSEKPSDEAIKAFCCKHALIPPEPKNRQHFLRWFDSELKLRPTLERIFCPAWRAEFRVQFLTRPASGVEFPQCYAAPWLEGNGSGDCPSGFQDCVEKGAAFLDARAPEEQKQNLFARLRGRARGELSAVEELLLAFGLVEEFGVDAVEPYPIVEGGKSVDFRVRLGDKSILVEATGKLLPEAMGIAPLGPSKSFRACKANIILKAALAKLCQRAITEPLILVLSEYSFRPSPTERDVRCFLETYSERLPVLGLACIHARRFEGVSFDAMQAKRFGLAKQDLNRLEHAIVKGFFGLQKG